MRLDKLADHWSRLDPNHSLSTCFDYLEQIHICKATDTTFRNTAITVTFSNLRLGSIRLEKSIMKTF